MAQIRGTNAGYGLNQNFGGGMGGMGGPSRDTMNEPSQLEAIRAYTDKVEDALDTLSDPVKVRYSLLSTAFPVGTEALETRLKSCNSYDLS